MGKRTVCKVCGTEIWKRCAHCAMHDISDNGQRKRPLNRGNGEEP